MAMDILKLFFNPSSWQLMLFPLMVKIVCLAGGLCETLGQINIVEIVIEAPTFIAH